MFEIEHFRCQEFILFSQLDSVRATGRRINYTETLRQSQNIKLEWNIQARFGPALI